MSALRLLLTHRHLALLICAAALLLKLVVPAGYMIDTAHGHLAITICPGTVPAASMPMPMPHAHGAMPDHDKSEHGKPDMPCTFASHSAAALTAVDPILLVASIVFIMTLGLRLATVPRPSGPIRFRPPLRAPPAV